MFPEAKFAIGPPIDNGFYYDFQLPRPLTPEDLPEIERPHARPHRSRTCLRAQRDDEGRRAASTSPTSRSRSS